MDLQPGEGESYFQPFVMKGFSNSGFTMRAGESPLKYIEYALLLIDRINNTQLPPQMKQDLSFPLED